MTAISASMVKDLREKTGAGMLNCKNALTESNGDVEKAIEILRKKGVASAEKRAGRLASEGLICIHQDSNVVSLVEINCETDFVAKNEEFQGFVKKVAEHALKNKPTDLAQMLSQEFGGTKKSLEDVVKEQVTKIGENISIRRFALIEAAAGEQVGQYTHMGSKIGALVRVRGDAAKVSQGVLKDLAMHVAAAAPGFLNSEAIPAEVIEKEKEIYLAQLKESGKPPEILEKILQGKINKFSTEVCLVNQLFIKDPDGKNSVSKHLKGIDATAEILEFVRFQVGEGMAKKEEDFAAEVAEQIKS